MNPMLNTVRLSLNPEAVDKIRKLLALAKSPNHPEARLAADKAKQVADKHGIDMATIGEANIPGTALFIIDLNGLAPDELDRYLHLYLGEEGYFEYDETQMPSAVRLLVPLHKKDSMIRFLRNHFGGIKVNEDLASADDLVNELLDS